MIEVTKINDGKFILNSALIETIEVIPESKITLTNGKHYIVKEEIDIIIEKILVYENRKITIKK